jgi:hypothetical protein
MWRFRRGDLDQWIASRIGKASVDETDGSVFVNGRVFTYRHMKTVLAELQKLPVW